MQAGAKVKWGSDQLVGKIGALQGCGNVGYHLAGQLHRAGAQLIASDIDPVKVARVVAEFGATEAPVGRIHAVPADIFAPCALGAIINDASLPDLTVGLICGGANNQLLEPRHPHPNRRNLRHHPDGSRPSRDGRNPPPPKPPTASPKKK